MPFPSATPFLPALLGMFVCVSTLHAAKPLQTAPVPSGEIETLWVGPLAAGAVSCSLGALPPGTELLNFIFPPERYSTRLIPSECTDCASADTIRFRTAHLQMYFPRKCTYPVEVWVAGATGPDTCPIPDYSNQICWPPVGFDLDPGNDTLTVLDFALTMPTACTVGETAFLVIEFTRAIAACNDDQTKARLLYGPGCELCKSYNDWDFDGFENDLCDPVDPVGNLIMYVEVDTCFPPPLPDTPARVSDLATTSATGSSVSLRWTATGNDGLVGRPEAYLVRAATAPLNGASFENAPHQREIPATVDGGGTETYVFDGLSPGRKYWFALKARSTAGALSTLSNVVSRTTDLGPPLSGRVGAAIVARAQPTQLPVELLWQGTGLPSPGVQEIRVYDAFGSLIRVLPLGVDTRGRALWDGRDENGRLVRAGLYFARLKSGATTSSCRIALLR